MLFHKILDIGIRDGCCCLFFGDLPPYRCVERVMKGASTVMCCGRRKDGEMLRLLNVVALAS